jgi:hypothetical protein
MVGGFQVFTSQVKVGAGLISSNFLYPFDLCYYP